MYDSLGRANSRLVAARRTRNEALVQAQQERTRATRDADIEFSETVTKLRQRFDADLAEAVRQHRSAVRPAHQAFNRATIRAEREYTTTAHAAARTELMNELVAEIGLAGAVAE